MMHSEETAVLPVEPAYRVFREVKETRELHIINAGHTIMDRRMEAISMAMDWIADRLFELRLQRLAGEDGWAAGILRGRALHLL